MRWRITIRNDDPERVELRGYADMPLDKLGRLSDALKPFGLVIASPADEGYDPFSEDT